MVVEGVAHGVLFSFALLLRFFKFWVRFSDSVLARAKAVLTSFPRVVSHARYQRTAPSRVMPGSP